MKIEMEQATDELITQMSELEDIESQMHWIDQTIIRLEQRKKFLASLIEEGA